MTSDPADDKASDPMEGPPAVHPTAVVDPRALIHLPAFVGAGAVLEPGCVLGSPAGEPVHVGMRVRVGSNAVVDAGVRLGEGARIQPVSHVTRDVPPHAIVAGSPARIVGYNTSFPSPAFRHDSAAIEESRLLRVQGASLHRLTSAVDLRGSLVAGEVARHLPFAVHRFFLVFDVPGEHIRGEHAHKRCHQFLVVAHGAVTVLVDDGELREEVILDRNDVGLHIEPLTWAVQYRHSPDAVLLVLASDPYDPDDYIRDYEEFSDWVRRAN